MNLSEAIIKIHSIAAQNVGELEADEFISSLLVVILNDLKKSGELKPEKLVEAFEKKLLSVENAELADFEFPIPSSKRPTLYLVSND